MAPGKKTPVNTEFYGSSLIIVTLITDFGGELGIRTPGGLTLNGFQDRRIRPLCQLSGANVRFEG
jgi:hypothetical protein